MDPNADGTVRIGDDELPVRVASGPLAKARGHMFRTQTPGYALVFHFDGVGRRGLHMFGVPFALDAVWVRAGAVTRVERLRPWLGHASADADMVLELPAGEIDAAPGDPVRLRAEVPA